MLMLQQLYLFSKVSADETVWKATAEELILESWFASVNKVTATYPASNYMFKVNNGKTRTSVKYDQI